MKTTDGRDNDILDKQGVETDAKDRKETLKDANDCVFSRNEQQKV